MTTTPDVLDLRDEAAAGGRAGDDRSLGQLVAAATKDLSALMRKEVELAKLETKLEIQHAVKGGVGFGIAAVCGLMVLLFGSAAAGFGIGAALDRTWLGFLIVTGFYLLLAVVGVLFGLKNAKQVGPPSTSIESVKSDIAWAKHPTKTPAQARAAEADTEAKERAKTVKKAVKDQSKAVRSFTGT